MSTASKIVTHLPLRELWRADGFTTTSRGEWLAKEDIASLLQLGRVQFVVVDVGVSPQWIDLQDCHDFWKREVKPHLAAPDSKVILAEFLDNYCYLASKWDSEQSAGPIVVLEKSH